MTLLAERPRKYVKPKKRRLVRLWQGGVSAGFPLPSEGYYSGDISIDERLIRDPAATWICTASGHSMVNAHINDGDYLVVDRGVDVRDGSIVIAHLDGELTVKRLQLRGPHVTLLAENPDHPNIELVGLNELTVFGVVTWILHPAL